MQAQGQQPHSNNRYYKHITIPLFLTNHCGHEKGKISLHLIFQYNLKKSNIIISLECFRYSQFLMSEMKTARPRIPSPRTAGMVPGDRSPPKLI